MALGLLAVVALVSACGSGSTGRRSESDGARSLTAQLVDELSTRYEVARGYPKLYTRADCEYTFPALHNCLGNNPAAPYILPVVPTWPNEHVDPALESAFGETRDGTSATYRLDPREAIVVLGTLPPPGRYLGLETYLATHEGGFDEASPTYRFIAEHFPTTLGTFFATVPQNPGRVQSFSDLGNSINNVVIERQSGASFGTRRFFVITADAGMDQAVRRALGDLGVRDEHIFTEEISSTGIRLGLDASADDFVTTMRYALPDDADAGDDWRDSLPLSVIRVRERPSSDRAAQPYPAREYEARTATPESGYATDFEALVAAVCARGGSCSDRTALPDLEAPPFDMVGPACRPIGMNCLAPTQDTPYYFSSDKTLDDGEVYAVAGTLGTETGNATYVSIGINQTSRLLGVASIDDRDLEGSAASFAATVGSADALFVYYLTRDCTGLDDLTDGRCLSITEAMIPPGDAFKVSIRVYVRPGTARGPDSAQLLNPTVMRIVRG